MSSIKNILASKSPRRQELLRLAGFDFELRLKDVDEYYPGNLEAEKIAPYLAHLKAEAWTKDLAPDELLITADTIVVLKGEVIEKASDLAEAKAMLQKISGQQHQVFTGVNLHLNGRHKTFTETTSVYFNVLRESDIDYYLEHFPVLDKAGAYGIQDWIGRIGVGKIEGCYYNVMGFPSARFYNEYQEFIKN